jgi:Sulfotransferase family
MTSPARPIVIAGLPRSGTSWTLQVLGTSPGVRKAYEPDNEEWHPAAIHGKHRLGRYPMLAPGQRDRAYHRLWDWILHGAYEGPRSQVALFMLNPGRHERTFEGRTDLVTWAAGTVARDPRPTAGPRRGAGHRRVVAKSIHLQFALDWLTSEFDVDVLVLLRHPANVLASWMGMNLKDSRSSVLETRPDIRAGYVERWGVPLPGSDLIEQMSWRIGLLTAALEEAAARNPRLHVRVHDALCVDPSAQFSELFDELGLEWSDDTDQYLRDHDTPGEGFTVFRVASELSQGWEEKLDDDQLATLRRVLEGFPITNWSGRDFERRGIGRP